jgi:hypothetical protein
MSGGVYDPIRAIGEELIGLAEVETSLRRRRLSAQDAMTRAESELNDILKVSGFLASEMERKRQILRDLERERDGK